MIVIGLGSGRTGTASLAHMIASQRDAICFHEMNPTGVVFEGNPQPILNGINEFQRIIDGGDRRLLSIDYSRPPSVQTYAELQDMEQVSMIGDIAYYYLSYVDDILAVNQDVRFVCVKRDREQTVNSWLSKAALKRWPSLWLGDRIRAFLTRTPFYRTRNFWQEHDGRTYQLDLVWDSTFPKFQAADLREAIGKYWDYYYEQAEQHAARHPKHFRIFPIEAMSGPEGQAEILTFIGVDEGRRELRDEFHDHKTPGGTS